MNVYETDFPMLNGDANSKEQQGQLVLDCVLPAVSLNKVQEIVFTGSWLGKTYQEIATGAGYDSDYIKDVGYRLWRELSEVLGESITKQNFRRVLKEHYVTIRNSKKYTPSTEQYNSLMQEAPETNKSESVYELLEAPKSPFFFGRTTDIFCLERWVTEERKSLIGIFGLGGVGKTALTMQLVRNIQDDFSYVIWRSLRNAPDFKSFMASLIQSLTNNRNDLPEAPDAMVSMLLECLCQSRCLLILDDWDSVLRSNEFAGFYLEGYEPYGLLLRRVSRSENQSCTIITSREKPGGVAFRNYSMFPVESIYLRGLNLTNGTKFLQSLGITDTASNLEQLLNYYTGNPYALGVAAQTILSLFDGSVSAFLDHHEFIYGDIRRLLDQHFDRLVDIEKHIMFALAHNPTSVSLSDLSNQISLGEQNNSFLLEALESLYHRSLVVRNDNLFRQPSIIKEYILKKFLSA